MTKKEVTRAVARGWCSKKNSGKIMDVDLVEAIVDEVIAVLDRIVLPENELFERIWQAIKHWDIDNGLPIEGTDITFHGGVTGDDVRLIMKAISEPVPNVLEKV